MYPSKIRPYNQKQKIYNKTTNAVNETEVGFPTGNFDISYSSKAQHLFLLHRIHSILVDNSMIDIDLILELDYPFSDISALEDVYINFRIGAL